MLETDTSGASITTDTGGMTTDDDDSEKKRSGKEGKEKREKDKEKKEKEESKKEELKTEGTEEGEGPQDVDTEYHDKEGDKNKATSEKGSEKKQEKESRRDSAKKEGRGKGPQRVYIMKHAEPLDRVFPAWIKLAFVDQKKYIPFDLNQPLTVPKRENVPEAYTVDSPITEVGYVTAQMVGRGMRVTKTRLSGIYVSSALRCIQTGHGLLRTLNVDLGLKLRVEPGLFDWLGFYPSVPKWMTKKELLSANFQIDPDYKPVVPGFGHKAYHVAKTM